MLVISKTLFFPKLLVIYFSRNPLILSIARHYYQVQLNFYVQVNQRTKDSKGTVWNKVPRTVPLKIHNCCICRLIIVTQTIHDIVRKGPPKMNILLSFLYLCSKGGGLWEVVCLFIRPSVYCGIIKIRGANFRGLLNIYVLIIRIYVEKFKIMFNLSIIKLIGF